MTGTPTDPGILPRTLDVIFNSLDHQQQLSEVKVHPKLFSDLHYLSESEAEKEQQWKDNALNIVS